MARRETKAQQAERIQKILAALDREYGTEYRCYLNRPEFARDQNPFKERMREFYRAEAEKPRYLPGYQGCDGRQLQRMTHLEGMGDGTFVLFDYRDRDPLDYNARTWRLDLDGAVKR